MPDSARHNPLSPRSWPLAVKLSVDLLLAALIPLAIALWVATSQSRHALEQAGEEEMRLVASSTAARLDQLITDTARAAALLARNETVRVLIDANPEPNSPGADAAGRRLVSVIETNPDFASAFLVRRDGVCVSATSKPTIGADLSFREYVRSALSGTPFVSEFLVGSTTGEPGVYCASPMFPPDETDPAAKPIGVAVIKLGGKHIWEMVDSVRLGEDGFATIVDANGVVIAIPNRELLYHSLGPISNTRVAEIDPKRSYALDRIESLDLPSLMTRAMDHSAFGAVEFISPKASAHPGRRMVAGYASMKQRDWKVFVAQPHTQLEEASVALARKQGLVALVVAVLAAGLAVARARTITRPVIELSDAATKLGGGNLKARAPVRSGDEIGRLAQTFNDMGPRLEEAMDLRHSLAVAMEVQQSLLPAKDPTLLRFEVSGRSRYCETTGGDYYDFIDIAPIAPGQTLIAVGDVMGHGIAAALLMASARAALRTRAMETGDLASLLTRVNAVLSADRHERFMTLALVVISADAGTMRWASAGHDPPFVFQAKSRTFQDLDGGDIPLGIEASYQFSEFRYEGLHAGDLVIIGTDGIWEAPAPGGDRFGKPRLLELIRANADKPVAEISESLEESIRAFRGPAVQEDDITFVIVRVK